MRQECCQRAKAGQLAACSNWLAWLVARLKAGRGSDSAIRNSSRCIQTYKVESKGESSAQDKKRLGCLVDSSDDVLAAPPPCRDAQLATRSRLSCGNP